jgi:hypothetical protein
MLIHSVCVFTNFNFLVSFPILLINLMRDNKLTFIHKIKYIDSNSILKHPL